MTKQILTSDMRIMKRIIYTATTAIICLLSLTACSDSEDSITPSGNYSPIRGGFPQGDTEYDSLINIIKKEYGVYLLYKDITEEDLQKLYEDYITYDKAYEDAYNAIEWPTETELRIKAGAYKIAWKECIIKLEEAIKFNSIALITNLSEYYFRELQRYFIQVLSNAKQFENPQEYAERLFKQTRSLDFMKRDIRKDVDDCFYVTEIYKFIRKRMIRWLLARTY